MEILTLLVLIVVVLLLVNCITAGNMRDLGTILILLGLFFFGWPLVAIGAVLIIAHYYKG